VPHDTALIATIAVGLGVAFVLGLVATRLGLPPLVGYLVAGIVVGPFTPGYVADSGLAGQVAELGVVLLMFGVGLHFSLSDLAAVRRVVVPGAIAQTLITGTVVAVLGHTFGWPWGGAVVMGLALGVASTVVLLKGLEQRDNLDSPDGRLGIGWLVVEDLTMVVALVLLPALAPALRDAGGAAPGAAISMAHNRRPPAVRPISTSVADPACDAASARSSASSAACGRWPSPGRAAAAGGAGRCRAAATWPGDPSKAAPRAAAATSTRIVGIIGAPSS